MERRGISRKTHDKKLLQKIAIRFLTEPQSTLKSLAREYGLPVRTLYYHLQRRHFHLADFRRLYDCDSVTAIGKRLVGLKKQKAFIEGRYRSVYLPVSDVLESFHL